MTDITEPELSRLLTRLTNLTTELHDNLVGTSYPAASGSGNGGKPPKGGKSKPPCSVTDLDYIVEDVEPFIHGWAKVLSSELHIGNLPFGQEIDQWLRWLHRHRTDILNASWCDTAVEEWKSLESMLVDRLRPADEHQLATMWSIAKDRKASANDIAKLLSAMTGTKVKRDKVRYLGQSGRVTVYQDPRGATLYSLAEVREAIEDWTDNRVK